VIQSRLVKNEMEDKARFFIDSQQTLPLSPEIASSDYSRCHFV